MVVLNPNNWHWVDKNTLPWTKDYFNEKLNDFQVVTNDKSKIIKINQIDKITGDSNVSQRKGKPICYFDLQMDFSIQIINDEQEEQEAEDAIEKGTLSIPEFMHDEDSFEMKLTGFSKDIEKIVKDEFLPSFNNILLQYQDDLITSHSKDLQH
ncbi:hypothetical protein NCAS_0I02610 [Naumovozyma castellii]|uniref:Activator of Hsp90 ATPase AHSA1-like N-terminal domain-containing protein n=1 Tax=Naumovozyma castellii TaxID=27288 RepID=G0VK95_NAUCA|nr:hypothetical protein NCAS_0I02610 [Naumovozyma castellii CBS 4309]CCC71929.1 hypothetical protein NCAS_0I02610 [Naumovozyma castellii CBS 4309]